MFRALLIGLAVAAAAQPLPIAAAQPSAVAASPELVRRAEDVAGMLRGTVDPATMFAPTFLANVPLPQIAAVRQQLIAQGGEVQRVEAVQASSPTRAVIRIGAERAVLVMTMGLEAQAPHRIINLLVTGVEPRGTDTPAEIAQELQALPGQVSFAVARLEPSGPVLVGGHNPDQALAIGSTFKLIVLGELSRQVRAGQRRWSDVVEIDRHSLPSGILQDWPLGSPVTLHTLASLMISRSDNTATDVLLRLAGRENVERMMTTMGMRSAARNRPFLTTMELFQLKADEPEILARWRTADEAARRRLLRERYQEGGASIELARLAAGTPAAIDNVEWFASAMDLARVMHWLQRNGDETAHGIMAISPGMSEAAAAPFSYAGFKGGSEPGVINLTYLLRNNEGQWHVVTGSWNNPAAAVDEGRFVELMARAVLLAR